MMRSIILAALVAVPLAAAAEPATDANIVTGFDVSGSMKPDDMRTQIVGLAQALRAPDVIEAIGRGHHGRVGIAVYTWSDHLTPPTVVVPWTIVATPADAVEVASTVVGYFATDPNSRGMTNISSAIHNGAMMIATAPFRSERNVINIIGNGSSNVGRPPARQRDAFVALGGTINGVVISPLANVRNHYADHVIGGIGSFVLSASDASDVVNLMRRKLILDLVSIGGPRL